MGCVLALTGVVPAATSTEESPLTVSFPESGARVSGGDVTFRGTVGDGDPLRQYQTRVQYVVDVSGSTSSPLQDCNGDGVRDALDDFNGDGRYGDVLDCEISAVVALNASLRAVPGSAAQIRVGLTAFGSTAAAAQMEEDTASSQFVAPGLTGDGKDVIPNLNFVASSLREGVVGEYVRRSVGTSTNFDAALTTALDTLEHHPGPRWVFFLSDGQASVSQATLNRVSASGVGVRTFAVGNGTGGAPCAATAPLGLIAGAGGDGCVRVLDPSDLTASVVGSQPEWLTSVTVDIGGRTVPADIDPIGGWSAVVPGLPTGSHTATVTANLASGVTWTTVVPFRVATHLSYTALGDSYASGEGVRPYLQGLDEQLCHRSRQGWPMLVATGGDPEPLSQRDDAVFRFVACSGARIVNLDTTPQPKEVGAIWSTKHQIPLQLDQLNPDADLVTLSIGGNDLGFAPIVMHCFTTLSCPEHGFITTASETSVSLDDWMTIRLALIGNELTGAYRSVRDRVSPDTTIVATTYPRLVSSSPIAHINWACMPQYLSIGERHWLRSQVDTFAAVVQERATRPGAGVQVVDVRDDFEGRNACDRDAHILGPTLLRFDDVEFSPTSAASFHPTERGTRLYAAAVNDLLSDTFESGGTGASRADAASAPHPTAARLSRTAAEGTAGSLRAAAARPSAAAADVGVVTDPDGLLAQYPPDVVDAVGATTFAEVFLGNGAAIDGHPACDDVVADEIVPLLARGFAPGSTVTAATVAVGHDGTEYGRTSTTHRTDDDGTLRSSLVAPDVGAEGLLTVSLTGTNPGGGPALGTALASTSADPACRAAVGEAGRLASADAAVPTPPGSTGTAGEDPGGTGPQPPATAASASRLSTTGAQIAGACAAALALITLGAGAAALSRRPGSDTDTSPDAPSA
jgi:lysophospholipase L1-like esterase